ncbi:MAG: hypothetical protein WCK03_04365 [Candidatus Taylorbacteria bacterium]
MDYETGFYVRAAHVFDRAGHLYIQRYLHGRTFIYQFTMMINVFGNEKLINKLCLAYGGHITKSRWRVVENQAKLFLTDIMPHSKRYDYIKLAMDYFQLRQERWLNRHRITGLKEFPNMQGVIRYVPVFSFNFPYSDKFDELREQLKHFKKNSTTP